MKKTEENRYPHSATLFKFCKEALEIRYEGNVKVIDQDVGAILGYDPADCSHWKKGKKNIRALSTLKTISDHLSIDERLLIDVASGKIGLKEAVYEFKGYGAFALQGRNVENLKKDFFKNPSNWQEEATARLTFEEMFDVNRSAVVELAKNVLALGNFTEAPIYVPELTALFENLTLASGIEQEDSAAMLDQEQQTYTIKVQGSDMRPYQRFIATREIYNFLITSNNSLAQKLSDAPKEVQDIRANLFAGHVLVPSNLLRKEVENLDNSKDLVTQLADTFWVSKGLMNQRLRDYLENLS
jgi:hypothetical protein